MTNQTMSTSKNNIVDVFPMNDIQRGMVLLSIMNPEAAIYHDQFVYFVPPVDDRDVFIKALKLMMEKHPILRTGFDLDSYSDEVQIVYKEVEPKVDFRDLTGHTIPEQEKYIQDYMVNDRFKVYDFQTPPLWKITIFNLNEKNSAYLIQFHHAVLDGWSLASLNTQIFNTYAELKKNSDYKPEPLKVFFKDLVIEELAEKNNTESINYWKEKLKNFSRLDIFHPDKPTSQLARIGFGMDKSIKIKEKAKKQGIDYKNIAFGAFVYVLNMLAMEDDFVVGVVSNNRPPIEDGDKVLGCFLNTLPLRLKFDQIKNLTWLEYFKFIQDQMTELKTKDRSTLLEITKITDQREGTENPFFDVFFNHIDFYHVYKDLEVAQSQFQQKQELKVRSFEMSNTYFDINFIDALGGELMMEYALMKEFKSNLSVEKFHEYFMEVIACFLDNSDEKVSNDIVLGEERNQILNDFNNTGVDLDASELFIDLFLRQVEEQPEKEALATGTRTYSYKELDALSNQLAHYLNEKVKLEKEDLVGVKLPRSEWLVISILAIWKNAAAYVPIDPAYPESRIAFMEQDSGCKLIIDAETLSQFHDTKDQYGVSFNIVKPGQSGLAYMIYTSGSTGKPKGVMIEHLSLVNFFKGMDQTIGLDDSDHLLALTSISFDISILELFWTLSKGVKTTIKPDNTDFYDYDSFLDESCEMDFSLFYFASQDSKVEDKYKFLLDSAKFGDEHDFNAVWLPERHFHEFGGIFPNPSVLAASIASTTKNIGIRSGSVVLPLHDPIRVAEEWSVVDNLSKGRVALSIASGWHADDFVFKPENYAKRHEVMYEQIEELKALWKGESVKRTNGTGKEVELKIYPEPIQSDIPVWITSAGHTETFRSAGRIGANLLTHLLGQDVKVLEENIRAYKEELERHGHDVSKAEVTLMLHTYVGTDIDEVKAVVKEPFKGYLRSSIGLLKNLLKGLGVNDNNIEDSEMEDLLEMVFERYWTTSALFGTRESCGKMLRSLHKIGVTEIGCLIDFGIDSEVIMDGLVHLSELKDDFRQNKGTIKEDAITAMQITPSYLGALLEDRDSHKFISSLKKLIVGGEYFPQNLKKRVLDITHASVHNMYGPTETTIWSTTCKVNSDKGNSIGKPIANTQVYILNKERELCPIGVKGELYIGGKGLSRGYKNAEELTREKFIKSPFNENEKIYRTGDLARWLPDGTIEFFGREDGQVKIRGHRIELGEIEYQISTKPGIDTCVVIDRESKLGQKELVAFVTSKTDQNSSELKAYLLEKLPAYMVPSYFIQIDAIPVTPNGKVDKKALFNTEQVEIAVEQDYLAPRNETEKALVAIWEGILSRTRIGIKDSFFDIGGNSLSVVKLRRVLKKELDVSIRIADLFQYVTIEDLAQRIAQEKQDIEKEEVVNTMEF